MIVLTSIFLIIQVASTHTSNCKLSGVLKREGHCVCIRDCKYQIGRFRLGTTVNKCENSDNVCCPQLPSISEQKCLEYKELLHAPMSYSGSRFDQPVCASQFGPSLLTRGSEALPFEYPHVVALGYGDNPEKLKFLCQATLISDKFLLTSANCVTNQQSGKPSYALIGDVILNLIEEDPPLYQSPYRKVLKISKHIVHPEYQPALFYNDIALLELETALELSRYILPACIGNPLTTPLISTNKPVQYVEGCGWGLTNDKRRSNFLQTINITTLDRDTCNAIFSQESYMESAYPKGIEKSQICASEAENRTAGWGDVGGGLFIRKNKCVFHVVGVKSKDTSADSSDIPTVYTTVASYQDWIESIVWGSDIN